MRIAIGSSSCGIPLALAGIIVAVVARPHARPTTDERQAPEQLVPARLTIERSRPACIVPAVPVQEMTPRSDGEGGYYVVAVVASIEAEPINAVVDHVELCILDGERIGIETVRYTTHVPLGLQPGQAILAHVAPGPVIGCEVPPGSSVLYLECVPRTSSGRYRSAL
jgi:hypothetical protein